MSQRCASRTGGNEHVVSRAGVLLFNFDTSCIYKLEARSVTQYAAYLQHNHTSSKLEIIRSNADKFPFKVSLVAD